MKKYIDKCPIQLNGKTYRAHVSFDKPIGTFLRPLQTQTELVPLPKLHFAKLHSQRFGHPSKLTLGSTTFS